jgi:hypothetical protein
MKHELINFIIGPPAFCIEIIGIINLCPGMGQERQGKKQEGYKKRAMSHPVHNAS